MTEVYCYYYGLLQSPQNTAVSPCAVFMGHRMTASLFDWVGSDLVGTYVPTRGLFIFARNVNTVEKIMTDKVLFPTR